MTIAAAWNAIRIEPWRPLKTEGVFKLTPASDPDACEGTTGFFRHLAAHDTLISYLKKADIRHDPRVLFAPSSVGCEPVTFLIRAHEHGLLRQYPGLRVYALDISDVFLAAAHTHAYPAAFGHALPRPVRENFFRATHEDGQDFLSVADLISGHLEILPPQNLMEYSAEQPYDAALSMHLLEHTLHVSNHSERVLRGLVGNAKMVCVSPAYFLQMGALRGAFAGVSREPVFATLDRNMKPSGRLDWKGDLSVFQKSRGPDGETFIFRHDI